ALLDSVCFRGDIRRHVRGTVVRTRAARGGGSQQGHEPNRRVAPPNPTARWGGLKSHGVKQGVVRVMGGAAGGSRAGIDRRLCRKVQVLACRQPPVSHPSKLALSDLAKTFRSRRGSFFSPPPPLPPGAACLLLPLHSYYNQERTACRLSCALL